MAMYYYASKLSEASCSGCNVKVSSTTTTTTQQATVSAPLNDQEPLHPEATILRGSALSYYDNDDYYSMIRGSSCKHIVMNGGINLITTQTVEASQLSAVLAPTVKAVQTLPYIHCGSDKPDVEYRDGQIVSASFDALVDMLRPGANKSVTFTFLLCSRLFVKPHELLNKLCKRYFKNYDKIGKCDMKDLLEKEVNDMIALVRVLNQWTTMFPYDFRDDRVMALVRSITQRCASEHMTSVRIDMSTTLERLLGKLTALEQYEETLRQVPQVSSMDQLTQGDILTLGLTPVELANQLTIVELHKLSFVGPEEFVQTFAPGQAQQSTSTCGMGSINLHLLEAKTTRNLEAYADWFNRLSYLVATDILKAIKSKLRARIIEQWVMTARECFNLGNFNSLMAIISALNMSPISRLKKTWARTSAVCGQQLRQLELCVEPTGNHARYRAALAAAPTETAVPLLTVTCRDLHFANQGSPSKLSSNRVNFEKCTLLSKHVSTQLAARRLTTEGNPTHVLPSTHTVVWRYLNDGPTLTEYALEVASFEREPPVDQLEKERFKRLRGGS